MYHKTLETVVVFTDVPGPPAAPEVCNILSTSCTVRFQPPADEGNAPVTGYRVQRCIVVVGDEGYWETVNETPVTDLELVVDHLQPLERYQFRVAAVNVSGVGDFGPPSQFITTDHSVCIDKKSKLYLIYTDCLSHTDRSYTHHCIVIQHCSTVISCLQVKEENNESSVQLGGLLELILSGNFLFEFIFLRLMSSYYYYYYYYYYY